MVSALIKPSNYISAQGTGGVRGNLQQTGDFAVWNITSQNWQHVLPPELGGGKLYGLVAVGGGVLAYGGFTNIGGKPAAGLAFYDGQFWGAPENLGLFKYGVNVTHSQFDNPATTTGVGYAAVGDGTGNGVFLLGDFNQVGSLRGGVAGLVQLTFSGGAFSVSQVGGGYNEQLNTNPPTTCLYCPKATQAGLGTYTNNNRNKLLTYASGTSRVFVYHDTSPAGNLWVWTTGTGTWVEVTTGNGAIGMAGTVTDFDVDTVNGKIYAVGTFSYLSNQNNQYLYLAVSTNNGQTFQSVVPASTMQQNYGNVPAVCDQYGVVLQPALTGYGFTAIAVANPTTIYVSGGWRVSARSTNISAGGCGSANELQTRISLVTISGTTGTIAPWSQRFGPSAGVYPDYQNVNLINKLQIIGNDLYAFGSFTYYQQVVPIVNNAANRFSTRYIHGMKGAIIFAGQNAQNGAPAFGGFLSAVGNDNIPSFLTGLANAYNSVNVNNLVYFGSSTAGAVGSTWQLLSSAIYQYGGDPLNNANNHWNTVFGNQRFVTAQATYTITSVTGPFGTTAVAPALPNGAEGSVNALHITHANNILVFGGQFDYIGANYVPGIGFYNPDTGSMGSVGAGLFQYNSINLYYSDAQNDNRIGGIVYDIDECNNYLYAAGQFNRNNSGNALANIARIAYTVGGGWLSIDGGCDGIIYDIQFSGTLLYVTGSFSFCGLNPEGYTATNLYRGRVPTSGIAVIDVSVNPSQWSWRPLGLGLQGTGTYGSGIGCAMANKGGNIYVGGTFSSAGGALYTSGIARWDGTKWNSVVSVCQDYCSRDNPQTTYYPPTTYLSDPTTRKPTRCNALRTLGSNVYCIDPTTNFLAWWDGNVWRRAGGLTISRNFPSQNSAIVYNGTQNNYIVLPGSAAPIEGDVSPGFIAWNQATQNFESGFGGFSSTTLAQATASSLIISQLILFAIILIVYLF